MRLLAHPNLLALTYLELPDHPATFSELYMVTPLMATDLAAVVRSGQRLSEKHVCYFSSPLPPLIHLGSSPLPPPQCGS